MSTSKAVLLLKLSVVALLAFGMPRSTSRAKVQATPPLDGQPDDEATPKSPR